MPSGEPRVSQVEESPSETSKQQLSKGPQARTKPPRATPNGTSSSYVSPYRQTQRSVSTPTAPPRVNSASAANPAHAAKFKDIVTKFNEKRDEKIPLPTNSTSASRMASPAARVRKGREEVKKTTPPWKPGGSTSKAPTKDTAKSRPSRSTSAIGSYESRATSRASSRASTVSTVAEQKRKRPSVSQSVGEDSNRGSTDADDDTAGEMSYSTHPSEKRRSRSRSFAEMERPVLTLQTEPAALRHRRSRSNIEMSTSTKAKEPQRPVFDHQTFSKSPSRMDATHSPISPLSKLPGSSRKGGSQTSSPRGRVPPSSTASSRIQIPKTEPTVKKLSSLSVSPHSSRHVPQPAKSPTLRAYVTVPPPKKSPPLRSSRPRAQVSTPGNTPKSKFTKTTGNPASPSISKSDGSLQSRTPSRAKKKIPELGSVDFAARRATIQAAFNKSLKESTPKVIIREPSNGSLKEQTPEYSEEDFPETSSVRSNKESRKPIQETIPEEESEEEHFQQSPSQSPEDYQQNQMYQQVEQEARSDVQDEHASSFIQRSDSGSDIESGSSEEVEMVNGSFAESESEFEGLGASSLSPDAETPSEQLPSYAQASQDTEFNAAAAFYSQQNEKKPQAGHSYLSDSVDDDERVEMAEKVEMVERPSSKRFSLQSLPSLRKHIDSLPPLSQRVEDSPLSPFTKSLISMGEPSRSNVVPLIIVPDSPGEPRKPPPRLTDISQYLRPDSMATMQTEWTDVSADDRSDDGQTEYDYANTPQQERSPHEQRDDVSPRHSRLYPNGVRISLGGLSVTSPAEGGLYTPTDDDGATIVSFIDRYDEPREDFLSPYLNSPYAESPSEYATTSADSERGDDDDGDDSDDDEVDEDEDEDEHEVDGDDNYEGDDDDISNCSSETMHSSARPSIESTDDWQNRSYTRVTRLPAQPESPPTPRRTIDIDSPPPPTPPPKDSVYLPPVPRKNSIPFPEPYVRIPSTQVQGRKFQPITLPEIAPDTEPLGLAIRLASPLSIASMAYEQDTTVPAPPQNPPPRPPLDHSQTAPAKPFSPPSSYYSDQDASRRSSAFTSVASPRASEVTLPLSLGAGLRTQSNAPTRDSVTEQKALVKRKHIMKELLDTEKSFFQDMTVTEEIYKGTANACSALTADDVKVMFGNTDAIVQFSKIFQESLKAAVASVYVIKRVRSNMNSSSVSLANSVSGDETSRGSIVSELSFLTDDDKDRKTIVGEAFKQHLPRMEKIYGDYCKNHEAAVARLQKLEGTPGIAIWLRECKTVAEDLTNAWSLESLLIKPVQRILKYPLMLRALLDATPVDHPDFISLEWAEKELRLAADRINELKKRKDIVEKIVRKRNDTDIRHGLSKLITRRTEIFRQQMGTSEAVIDPNYNKMVENFHMHYVQLQLCFRDIDGYIIKVNEFFQQFLEIPAAMREFVELSPTPYPEIETKWKRFDSAMKDMVKLALSEHTHRVKKHCVEPIESLLRLYDNPQRLMLKRNKKSVDYARFTAIREKGAVPDKKTKDLAEAYTALNEALIDELPTLFNLTKKLVLVTLENFVELQFQWNQTFSGTLITSIPDTPAPEQPSEIVATFREEFAYYEAPIKELGICNGATVTTLQAMTSPTFGLPSSSTVSLEEPSRDSLSHHRPNTADPVRERERERSTSFSNRSVSSLDHHHRRHSGEMPVVAAAISALATAMPGASHMVGQSARARASSSVYPLRGPHSPGSPSVLRSLSASSPTRLAIRPPTSHPRPPSSATSSGFAPVPETTVTPDFSRDSSPSSQHFTGAFSSALPMSDSEPSPGPSRGPSRNPSRPSSRHSSSRRSDSRRRTLTISTDSEPMFVAVSMFEFNIDKERREAGFPYLTYVQGEVFDVIGVKGEIWLAKNQDDSNGEIGWIWCKHFHSLKPE